jgi:4-cresol dehydrogenase (hydroxylating)
MISGVMGPAAMRRSRQVWQPAGGPLTDEFYAEAMNELGLGRWNARCALYGADGVVEAQARRIQGAFEATIADTNVEVMTVPGTEVSAKTLATHNDRVQGAIPGIGLLDILRWWGPNGGHIDFSPVCPLRGADVRRLMSLIRAETIDAGFDHWPTGIMTSRAFICVHPITFSASNEPQVRAAYDLYARLVGKAREAGFGLYRGHIDFMDEIADCYDFNDHVQRRFNETLKNALDPNGIFAAGKQGIWPRRGGIRFVADSSTPLRQRGSKARPPAVIAPRPLLRPGCDAVHAGNSRRYCGTRG